MRRSCPAQSPRLVTKLMGAVCLSVLVAGCNQSSRFSDGLFTGTVPVNVGEGTQTASQQPVYTQPYPGTGSQSLDQTKTGSVSQGAYPPAPVQNTVNSSSLAPVAIPDAQAANQEFTSAARATAGGAGGAGSSAGKGWTTAGGTRVTIGQGDTVYGLSRRYGVPADDIMKANGISNASSIQVGQSLVIPTYNYGNGVPVSAPDNDPKTQIASAATNTRIDASSSSAPAPRQVLQAPSDASQQTSASSAAGSSYVVQSGDSLNRISANTGVSVADLQKANGLTGTNIRIGQTLKIPASGATIEPVKTAAVTTTPVKTEGAPKNDTVTQTASLQAEAPKATGIDKLRWPATGQVMTPFGGSTNGRKSDGIDISVPEGTPIKAAENGVVIYAGNGLKEYGNTVLVRHDDGLVSVYGHARELKVQRGDTVTRGEVVALSGMSGDANRPKVHFEIRKDAKPVDPMTYLE